MGPAAVLFISVDSCSSCSSVIELSATDGTDVMQVKADVSMGGCAAAAYYLALLFLVRKLALVRPAVA